MRLGVDPSIKIIIEQLDALAAKVQSGALESELLEQCDHVAHAYSNARAVMIEYGPDMETGAATDTLRREVSDHIERYYEKTPLKDELARIARHPDMRSRLGVPGDLLRQATRSKADEDVLSSVFGRLQDAKSSEHAANTPSLHVAGDPADTAAEPRPEGSKEKKKRDPALGLIVASGAAAAIVSGVALTDRKAEAHEGERAADGTESHAPTHASLFRTSVVCMGTIGFAALVGARLSKMPLFRDLRNPFSAAAR